MAPFRCDPGYSPGSILRRMEYVQLRFTSAYTRIRNSEKSGHRLVMWAGFFAHFAIPPPRASPAIFLKAQNATGAKEDLRERYFFIKL
jgi:hypothetical protein